MKGQPVFLLSTPGPHDAGDVLKSGTGIPKDCALTEEQQDYVAGVLMEWIERQMKDGLSQV